MTFLVNLLTLFTFPVGWVLGENIKIDGFPPVAYFTGVTVFLVMLVLNLSTVIYYRNKGK